MSEYYFLITDAGKALEVAAHASGEPVMLTEFAVGDGNGEPVTPDTTQTVLMNEVYRDVLSSLKVNPSDSTVLEAECVIPSSSGGYTIREVGIFADDGTLYAIGNYPDQEKPAPDSGFAASLDIFAELAVSDTSDIKLTVQDGSYLTEPQADTLYLRQDKKLGEIAGQGADAQTEARENIGCGTAATGTVVTSSADSTPARIPMTGWMGWGGPEIGLSDGTDIYKFFPTAISGNYGGGGDLPNSTSGGWHSFKWQQHGSDHKYGFLLEHISNGQMAAHVYNNPTGDMTTPEKYWAKYLIYSQAYKPTAIDTGALPLSKASLNVDLNTLGATSSAGVYYQTMSANATTASHYPIQEAGTLVVTPSAYGCQQEYTAFGSARKFVRGLSGNFSTNGPWHDWIEILNTTQANANYYTQSAANAKFVQGVQLGSKGATGDIYGNGGDHLMPAGCVMTGLGGGRNGDNIDIRNMYYKPIQENVNGTWKTVAG